MKKSTRTIAAIAMAAVMATGMAVTTASAASYKTVYSQAYTQNYNFIDAETNNVTMLEGESEYVTVTAEGSHSIKAISYDPAVANVKFASKKFHGDDIDIRITAKRAGITDILICNENRKDIEDIPERYVNGLTFHYVENVKDVLDFALL